MMERVVPTGISRFGWGTITVSPAGFLNFGWLPRWETKRKPCASSTRMISAEPSRLGMDQLLPNLGLAHEEEVLRRRVFKIKLHRFPQRRDRFTTRRTEAGDINVQTLSDVKFLFPIQAVGDGFHTVKLSEAVASRNDA